MTHSPGTKLVAVAVAVGFALLAPACNGQESSGSEASEGGETPARRAKRRVDKAHEDFKESVKPAANWVDEKTSEVVEEGGRAVDKVAGEDASGDED